MFNLRRINSFRTNSGITTINPLKRLQSLSQLFSLNMKLLNLRISEKQTQQVLVFWCRGEVWSGRGLVHYLSATASWCRPPPVRGAAAAARDSPAAWRTTAAAGPRWCGESEGGKKKQLNQPETAGSKQRPPGPTGSKSPHLQRRAVLRERRAEEGGDGVENHIDDVFLQNRVGQTFLALVADLQKKKHSDLKTWDSNKKPLSFRVEYQKQYSTFSAFSLVFLLLTFGKSNMKRQKNFCFCLKTITRIKNELIYKFIENHRILLVRKENIK